MFSCNCCACARQRSAKLASLRPRANLGKLREHVVKEKGEPDTFAAAFFSHQVHPVIPIAGAHQGQAVLAEFQSVLDRAHAMLVERGRFLGAIRQIVIGFLFRHNRTGFEKGNLFIEHARVRDAGNVAAGDVGQPEIVIGKMCAHAAARRRVPPMLDIAFAKLMRGGAREDARGSGPARRGPAPSHPAIDRGIHRLRRIDKSRCAPRAGSQGFDITASRWPSCSRRDLAYRR